MAALLWVQEQSENTSFRRSLYDVDYYQLIRWLSYTSNEIHKQIYRMVLYSEIDDSSKNNIRSLAPERFQLLDKHLAKNEFISGDSFSVADAHLAWAMLLTEDAGIDPKPYANLMAYCDRIYALPKVAETIADDRDRKNKRA